jgi:flagellar biosynthesis/type III secretory pathway protein FliH
MQQPSPSDEQQRYKAAVTKMAKTLVAAGHTARSLELASTVNDAAQKGYKAGYEAGVRAGVEAAYRAGVEQGFRLGRTHTLKRQMASAEARSARRALSK